jgi:methyl-accepting chemotaxis protein WspA
MRDMAGGAGDLTARVEVRSNDEIGQLAAAINKVIQQIHDLVVRVRESSIQLYASSTEIAATARQQESTMQNLGSSTNQIAVAVKEISATSHELAGTVGTINDGAKQVGKAAVAGRSGLAGMAAAMQRLSESTSSISGKLGVVREKANDINVVVTTITKVADQTNLLSINAAIEAEKAGEYGRGFLVVAREIRRLADQTAVATLDIENMVRQMQSAVSAGVMEMDKFAEEVRTGVAKVGEINVQMGQILEQMRMSNEAFQSVSEATSQQSSGAGQINDAMVQLAAGVQQTSASLKEFHQVTVNLRESADALKQQVARFTVAG